MDAALSPHISLEDPAFNVNFLATLFTDASGAAVSSVNGVASATAFDDTVPADDSSNVSCLAALSTDASGAAVPPVAGAAAGAAADAALTDDVGAPATPFDDTTEKTLVPVTASAAGAAAASATAVGADCCDPSDRENIGISTFFD